MNISQKSKRIVRLVRLVTVAGLAMIVITTGLVGWTVSKMRGERAHVTAEQERLDQAASRLRERAVESRAEIRAAFDETQPRQITQPSAVENFAGLIHAQLHRPADPAALPALNSFGDQAESVRALSARAETWRASYMPLWEDQREQRTLRAVRNLTAELRRALEMVEGQARLREAIKFRQWRQAAGEDAAGRARALLLEQARQHSTGETGFERHLSEFGRLVEQLGGSEDLDSLVDLKDNKLKPALDLMSRSIRVFAEDIGGDHALNSEAVEGLKVAVFGEGYVTDEAHQNIQPGRGGLFALRRDVLQLRRDRETLKSELNALFSQIEKATMAFARSTHLRTAALTQQMEGSLASGWRQMLIFGTGCSALFLWLAWFVPRVINSQVNALEEARAEAETARQEAQRLMHERKEQLAAQADAAYEETRRVVREMLEQQAAAAELAAAHKGLQTSEQRFRTLSTSAPIGIVLTDAAGLALYANPHWLCTTGLSLEQALGAGWRRAVHPEDAEAVFGEWTAISRTGDDYDREFRFLTPDGDVRWAHARTSPIRNETGELTGHVATVENITARKLAEVHLEKMHKELLETSRQAGMAEVATAVLHNVGNVLNSVNVAATCVADNLRKSKVASLARVVGLLRQHEADLSGFFSNDPKGRQLPAFLGQLAQQLTLEQANGLKELALLQKNIEHIKDIVAMQQSYAMISGITETVEVREMVEDALRMNAGALVRHDVETVREYEDVPPVTVEKHKVLQILVNLIRNAKYACDDSGRSDKRMTVRVEPGEQGVRIAVSDNGIGIPTENLTRIFGHGFTTKKEGHGFGLHSGALAAREMGGRLSVQSDGPGMGATFTLDLPHQPKNSAPAPTPARSINEFAMSAAQT